MLAFLWLTASACSAGTTELGLIDGGLTDARPLDDAGHSHSCTTFNGLVIPENTMVAAERGCNVCTCYLSSRGSELRCTTGACRYLDDPTFVPPANNPAFPWCDSQDDCVITYPGDELHEGKCLFDPGCGQRGRCIFTAHCEPRDEEPRVSEQDGWCGCDGRVYAGCPIAEWTGQYTYGTQACGN